jgi:hypothetical protein
MARMVPRLRLTKTMRARANPAPCACWVEQKPENLNRAINTSQVHRGDLCFSAQPFRVSFPLCAHLNLFMLAGVCAWLCGFASQRLAVRACADRSRVPACCAGPRVF